MPQLARRIGRARPSAIMQVARKAARLKAEGRDIINFSIGVPNFLPGEHVYAAAHAAVDADSGQYGTNLNKLVFTVEPDSGAIQGVTSQVLSLVAPEAVYPIDGPTQDIVNAAVAAAKPLGAVPLGELDKPFSRAKFASGSANRGGESTLGNLVAEVQRWATSDPIFGGAQIAFMNPGGLRADMVGQNASGYPAMLTYKQAALVQPFANTLVNMRMTGAQVSYCRRR